MQNSSAGTLHSGQSDAGNVCWTIANDTRSLELYFDSDSRTWLALN